MRVEELVEELKALPPTARVVVRVRDNIAPDGSVEPLYEFRDEDVEGALYVTGEVVISLDENSGVRVPDVES